jgi:hypothetical protein
MKEMELKPSKYVNASVIDILKKLLLFTSRPVFKFIGGGE